MKKTVATVMILTIVTVFFCASVSAATSSMSVVANNRYNQTKSNVNVQIDTVQLYPFEGGTYDVTGSGASSGVTLSYSNAVVIVTTRVTNNNSKTYYLDNFYITPYFNDSRLASGASFSFYTHYTNITNYGPDMEMSIDYNNGGISYIPYTDWSFLGKVAVPANSSVNCIFTFEIPARVATGSLQNEWTYPILNNVSVSNWSTYETDFTPQGAHDDIIISLEALRSALNSKLTDVNNSLGIINNELIDIESVLTWTGTYNAAGIGNRSSATNNSVSNVKVVVRNFGSIPVTDFEILPPNVVVSDVLYKHPIQIEIETTFTGDKKISGSFVINDFMQSGSSSFDNPVIYSDEINVVGIAAQDGYYDAYIRYEDAIIHKDRQFNSIWLYVYSRTAYLPVNSSFTVSLTTTDYKSDVESQSDSLVNQSNTAHTQEQAFFNQNSQAIANTGLGNYQFSVDQGSGISVVTGLFNRLWQSVGSWNSVYVFSLTITVALTILRYTTNAIKRRGYSDDKGGKP